MHKPNPAAQAAALLAGRSTSELLEMWYQTDRTVDGLRGRLDQAARDVYLDATTARGWLLTELERRDAAAFEAWMDGSNDDPADYFC